MPMAMLKEIVSSLQMVAACFYEDQTTLDVSFDTRLCCRAVTSDCIDSLPALLSLNYTKYTTLTSLFLYLICLTVPTKLLTSLSSMSKFEVNMNCAQIFNF